jgi:hypothetical protein
MRVKRAASVSTSVGTTTGAARASDGRFQVLVAVGAAERIYAGSANDSLYVLDLSGDSAPKSVATGATGGH